jgi:hypothetical protein
VERTNDLTTCIFPFVWTGGRGVFENRLGGKHLCKKERLNLVRISIIIIVWRFQYGVERTDRWEDWIFTVSVCFLDGALFGVEICMNPPFACFLFPLDRELIPLFHTILFWWFG